MIYKRTPALVLDCDKTVRFSRADPEGFISGVTDIGIYPEASSLIADAVVQGRLIALISNQGGVAFGHKTMAEASKEMNATANLIFNEIAAIVPHHEVSPEQVAKQMLTCFAPCMDGADSTFGVRSFLRKPYYGMLAALEVEAMKRGLIIDWDTSLYVGDRQEDADMANAADLAFVDAEVWRRSAYEKEGARA